MINKKVKAFTLSELLVVLVISSIVISITFLALRLVQKQINQVQVNFHDQQEIEFIERVLLNDINTHKALYNEKKDKLILHKYKDSITYHFNKDYFLRNKDTFDLKIIEKEFLLDNKAVNFGRIDAISLKFAQSYNAKEIFANTLKASEFYMNK